MRIGLFGGTFDPPHLGHLALSREAFHDLSLNRLLWILTPFPPHKRGRRITSLPHRLGMVSLALQGTPFELSRVDVDRPGPHYAVDTVRILSAQFPAAELIYLMGSDSLNDLPTWHDAAGLVTSLHQVAVMCRIDETPDLASLELHLPGLASRVVFLDASRVDISSSQVRRLAHRGKPFGHLLPSAVAGYIRLHDLYQPSTR